MGLNASDPHFIMITLNCMGNSKRTVPIHKQFIKQVLEIDKTTNYLSIYKLLVSLQISKTANKCPQKMFFPKLCNFLLFDAWWKVHICLKR